MEIDLDKSYCWGVDILSRRALAAFPVKCVQHSNELGGSLSFGSKPRVVDFHARMSKLRSKWMSLARSTASLHQKLVALMVSFWPEGLHGALACRFALSHLDGLRRKAAAALGWKLAGSSPAMRFLLCSLPGADPLLWHHKTVLQGFRRMCLGSVDFAAQWQLFWDHYDGSLHSGPYSKLVDLFSHLGWSFETAQCFRDHRGRLWHLLHTPWPLMEFLLWDAWAKLVATQFRLRKTASDLGDLDPWIHGAFAASLGALDRARLSALQGGCFISASQHARYDASQDRWCSTCGVLDTVDHWFSCPRFSDLRVDLDGHHESPGAWPQCFRNHLLLSRAGLVDELDCYFLQLDPRVDDFALRPTDKVHHVFTDGTAMKYKRSRLKHAAWAVVDSTSGRMVSGGPLSGLHQSISRAELTAALSATVWGNAGDLSELHIWSDSQYVVAGACFMLLHGTVPASWAHQDLWRSLLQEQELYSAGTLFYHWVPSHLDASLCCTPFECWVARWNSVADKNAGFFDSNRGHSANDLFERVRSFDSSWWERLDHTFRFLVAAGERRQQDEPVVTVLSSEPEDFEDVTLCSLLREGGVRAMETLSSIFLHDLQSWVLQHCIASCQPRVYSFLELVFIMAFLAPVRFPFSAGHDGIRHEFVQSLFTRPTISQLLASLKGALTELCQFLGVEVIPLDGRRMIDLGVFVPCLGIRLQLPDVLRVRCHTALRSWTSSRPIRRKADLARPFCC